MSEISQYLPMSQRPSRDESAVSNNWAPRQGTVLNALSGLLEGLSAAEWAVHSPRNSAATKRTDTNTLATTPTTIVAELVWRLRGSRVSRVLAVLRRVATTHQRPAKATAAMIAAIATLPPQTLTTEIRLLAARHLAPGARGTIRELGLGVAAVFEIAEITGRNTHIDPVTSGAVAVEASMKAPLPITAALRGTMIRAVDTVGTPELGEGWSVGRGLVRNATASTIVLFLYGRRGFPAVAGG